MLKKFFELNRPYKFDPTDITATIFLVAAIIGMCGGNTTPFFLVGSLIGTAFCWKAHRINLVVLNVALCAFNIYCAFWG